jgi:K+-transporting ATPase ATPase B chain
MDASRERKRTPASTLLDPKIVLPAIASSFVKLDPRTLM